MESLLIVGAGGFGRVVLEHAEKQYTCSFIDDSVPVKSKVDGIEIIGTIADLPRLTNYKNLVVAIGDNNLRERVYQEAGLLGYTFPSIVSGSAYISSKAVLGTGNIILNNVVIQSGAHAGSGLIINPGVELHNDCFVDDYALIYTNSVVRSNARVGKRARIGSTVTVGTGEIIQDDAVVGERFIKGTKSFEELWGTITATGKLPEMAVILMHKSFSDKTKDMLIKSGKSGVEIADMLNDIINRINRGSIADIDGLVQQQMNLSHQ